MENENLCDELFFDIIFMQFEHPIIVFRFPF